jgi:hypothetical protein
VEKVKCISPSLPHQNGAAATAKTGLSFNVVGHIIVTNDTPKPKPHNAYDKKRTMYVLIDGGANISVVQDASWMSNVKPAKANDVVMMNSHPAPVQGYGDLQVEVLDEASKKWRVLHLSTWRGPCAIFTVQPAGLDGLRGPDPQSGAE